jgi:hypothetical protein
MRPLPAASGGVKNMTAVERGRGRAAHHQGSSTPIYATLQSRSRSGEQKLDGRALRPGRDVYGRGQRVSLHEQKRAGFAGRHAGQVVMVRSIRHKRDSCRSCVGLDGKWFPMGSAEYIPVGRRECNVNCGCTEEMGTQAADGAIVGQGLEGF